LLLLYLFNNIFLCESELLVCFEMSTSDVILDSMLLKYFYRNKQVKSNFFYYYTIFIFYNNVLMDGMRNQRK